MKKKSLKLLFIAGSILLFLSCRNSEKNPYGSVKDDSVFFKTVAKVNGIKIGEAEIDFLIEKGKQQKKMAHDAMETVGGAIDRKNVLETIIRQELLYQKGLELGLDHDEEFLKKIQKFEIELKAVRRQEMANLVLKKAVKDKITVTDDEALGFFNENKTLIQTVYHVYQILEKDGKAKIEEYASEIKLGRSFEDVAKLKFPVIPEGEKAPWDLGYLHSNQLPEAWRNPLEKMKPGEVSEIIEGEGNRFWLIKLIDKKIDESETFEKTKNMIFEILKTKKTNLRYQEFQKILHEKASITFSE